MVFLAMTPEGLKEALALSRNLDCPVWCSSGAISELEFMARQEPLLSRFNYAISGSEPEVLAEALCTIEEHHPGHKVWVEAGGQS